MEPRAHPQVAMAVSRVVVGVAAVQGAEEATTTETVISIKYIMRHLHLSTTSSVVAIITMEGFSHLQPRGKASAIATTADIVLPSMSASNSSARTVAHTL